MLIDAVVDASRVGGSPVLLPLIRTIALVYDLFRLSDTLYPRQADFLVLLTNSV